MSVDQQTLDEGEAVAADDTVQVDPEQLKQAMKRSGLTYPQLAEAAKVSRSMIGHLRSGYIVTCRRDTSERIETALGMPIGSLFRIPDFDVLWKRRGAVKRRVEGAPRIPAEQDETDDTPAGDAGA